MGNSLQSAADARPGIWRIAPLTILAALLSACGSPSIRPPVPLGQDPLVQPANSVAAAEGFDPYYAFNAALAAAQKDTNDSSKQAVLLQEGMSLIAAKCAHYFAGLGSAEQHLRFARKETALTGGLAAAMLGLANASTKAVANTGALFSFSTASMDSYLDSYIFSPEVKALQTLVMDAMTTTQAQGVGLITRSARGEGSLSYTQVFDFLTQMESYCQPHGIRDLVTKAVNGVKTTATPAPAPPPNPAPAPAATPTPSPSPAPAATPAPTPKPAATPAPTSPPPAPPPVPTPAPPPGAAAPPPPPAPAPSPSQQSQGRLPALPTPRIAVEVVPKS
jgi:hypothetical protein